MTNETAPVKPWGASAWILAVILPVIAGILVSLWIPRPIVGVIYLSDPISGASAKDIIAQMVYAREDPQVRAVVLVLNSPGGTVSDSESIYLEANRLRQQKPVITAVEGLAASGAYYLAMGSDYIYVKSSSLVGNIGVISSLPPKPEVFEETYSTGPYKLWGEPREMVAREMEMLKQGFLQAVLKGRGSALKLKPDEILTGQIWLGSEAVKAGLADELGAQSVAFDKAAQMARIAHYETKDLRPLSGLPPVSNALPFFFQSPAGISTGYPKDPGIYFLYVPQMEVKK